MCFVGKPSMMLYFLKSSLEGKAAWKKTKTKKNIMAEVKHMSTTGPYVFVWVGGGGDHFLCPACHWVFVPWCYKLPKAKNWRWSTCIKHHSPPPQSKNISSATLLFVLSFLVIGKVSSIYFFFRGEGEWGVHI